MRRKLMTFIVACMGGVLFAQENPVLMTINGQPVTRSEFEYIYNKNNNLKDSPKQSIEDYLELFVNFKLKVGKARAAGLDTVRSFRDELNGYRRQLAESYMTDRKVEDEFTRQYYDEINARNPYGHMRVMHIFKYLPQQINKEFIAQADQEMSAIYDELAKDSTISFESMVDKHSDDKNSFWITFLQTPKEFEDQVYALNIGEYSKPFYSPVGIHIVKLLDAKSLPPYEKVKKQITEKYARIHGITKGTEALVKRLKKERGFVPNEAAITELVGEGSTAKALFSYAGREYNYSEFQRFASYMRATIQQKFDFFVIKSVLDYEYAHLDTLYPEFKMLMQEYEEGMLLYEISNQEVWSKATIDTLGQQTFFDTHKKQFRWEQPHYAGMVIHSVDRDVIPKAKKLVKKLPIGIWKDTIERTFNVDSIPVVKVDCDLYAYGENDYVDSYVFKSKKEVTPLEGFSFNAVYGKKQKRPKTYKEVGGVLIAEYQNFLDKLWIQTLREESVVEINEEVLKTVNKH